MVNDNVPTAESLGHEPIAADARGISVAAAALFATIFLSLLLVAGLMLLFAHLQPGTQNVATIPAPTIPPGVPALDPHQAQDLQWLRSQEQQLLGGYGWIDRSEHIARIPIRRAMEIMAEHSKPLGTAPQREVRHE
jgi:hypothetical protein